jgi:mannosyltransferase OCH1-like enzyme
MDSWRILVDQGFAMRTFSDATAGQYIAARYGPREVSAFARCRHPAMRSDYLRMCFVLAEGGIYVDADDVLVGDGWKLLLRSATVKVQALCYDVQVHEMVDSSELRRPDLGITNRIFYVNNNPLVAPAEHPVLRHALARATERLLGDDPAPEIQSTTGPGNMTAAVAAHARDAFLQGARPDVELLLDWNSVASTRWDLSYRTDERNWRNMDRRGAEG